MIQQLKQKSFLYLLPPQACAIKLFMVIIISIYDKASVFHCQSLQPKYATCGQPIEWSPIKAPP